MIEKGIFHPAVAAWFTNRFGEPTSAQQQAWPSIRGGHDILIAAPTGSGKTLAAFLAAIDDLVRQGLAGELRDETQIVYVSPLKALSNDIHRNLIEPLEGIRHQLRQMGFAQPEIRAAVRTGDTAPAERGRMVRKPPHIVVTTPESLYILLGSESGRAMLSTTRTIIVDEIHAVAGSKRGSHLALTLERLATLCSEPPLRVGLSATQKPIEEVARFLVGGGRRPASPACRIVDTGHRRDRDLAIEVPGAPLEAVMSAETWEEIYGRLATLIKEHRTTLIFVNTRRLAERVTRQLSDRLGEDNVTAHHGSLAKEQRLDAEQRLKSGKLRALVATASLELGIDIGEIDLVCQIGSPHSIASFLQRVGRSGHAVKGTPKGRLFPLSRDDLVECAALLDSVSRGELDQLRIIDQPLDVLAQQIVAEVGAREWKVDDLHRTMRRAYPYRNLSNDDFAAIVTMLASGFTTRRGRRGALIHHDAVNGVLRARRGTRLTALTAGGTIPDNADYQVLLEPENLVVGTLNEDFAVESLAGDVFQLGNRTYRILRVERGTVRVEDAPGMAPSLPFWLGEAPGRSDELSAAVSRLRSSISTTLKDPQSRSAAAVLGRAKIGDAAGEQLIEYLAAGQAALGVMPTQERIVFERFFDEAGGMQLVIHSPYGSRINRAWGLALRKRFCRKFNFELQAAATEDNIVLSLTGAHSFDLADVAHYLHSASVRPLLIQALLDAPMFNTRWRWVAGVSLALPRFQGGRKVAPQLVRMQAEDLVGAVFPDQIACAENLSGEREVPDHPLVRQTIDDCLTEALDITGFTELLRRIESGEIEIVARDLTSPSPLALEVLSARPYAFLDDAPLEERRTQAVMSRRWLTPEAASGLGNLDADAIARVRSEAWPDAANADELHDALLWIGFLTEQEVEAEPAWPALLADLESQRRVQLLKTPGGNVWIAAERLALFRAAFPVISRWADGAVPEPKAAEEMSREVALAEILRGRLEGLGPVTETRLASPLGLEPVDLQSALTALQVEGFAMRGQYTPMTNDAEWCDRRLLARIHGYTTKRLRAEIEPVAARDFIRFLLQWQHVTADARMEGGGGLDAVVRQLEGFEIPAGAWETEILPSRVLDYDPAWLDQRCSSGQLAWTRLRRINGRLDGAGTAPGPVRTTPITLTARRHLPYWRALIASAPQIAAGPRAEAVLDAIRGQGALFFDELIEASGLLRAEVEEGLGELVSLGLVTSDSFSGLRALISPPARRGSRGRRRSASTMEDAGRWALTGRETKTAPPKPETIEHVALSLLTRYGVVFWRLIEREAPWLPPWRDLLRVYRRLESHGDVRGGRFVAGFSGEQFALPEAVGLLRQIRRQEPSGEFISVSGADPLNLIGVLTPGSRLPALTGNRLLYRDGFPVAIFCAGESTFLESLDAAEEWVARKALLRSAGPAAPRDHFPRRAAMAR